MILDICPSMANAIFAAFATALDEHSFKVPDDGYIDATPIGVKLAIKDVIDELTALYPDIADSFTTWINEHNLNMVIK